MKRDREKRDSERERERQRASERQREGETHAGCLFSRPEYLSVYPTERDERDREQQRETAGVQEQRASLAVLL